MLNSPTKTRTCRTHSRIPHHHTVHTYRSRGIAYAYAALACLLGPCLAQLHLCSPSTKPAASPPSKASFSKWLGT